jgi:hypothetical protein
MSGYNAMVRRQAMEAACLGTYGPYKLQVTVNDSFDQWRYRIACTAIWGEGVGVPSFFIQCAEYFIRHHRKLAVVRREIREEEKRLRRKKRERERAERAAYRANPGMYLGKPPAMPKPRRKKGVGRG